MRIQKQLTKLSAVFIAIIIITFTITFIRFSYVTASPAVSITAGTNQSAYHLRQNVTVSGNLIQDGEPVSKALISLEVRDPKGEFLAFRTIPIGNPDENWYIEITNALATEKAEINSLMQLSVTIHNTLANHLTGVVTATVYDGNLIPIGVRTSPFSMSGGATESWSWSLYIPEWAYDGKATVRYNVYSEYPKDTGIPYAPEKTVEFYITRNLELDPPYSPPKSGYTTFPGQYNVTFQVPPDRYTFPGDYAAYVAGRISSILRTFADTSFNVESFPCPPQAAFTYTPLKVYQNMTVTFDGSSSSAEGYNDTIIQYEWTFNDPYNSEHIVNTGNYTHPPSPFAIHTFEYGGTYTVELNVTDNEELWSTVTKPIVITPEFGPTANFTWTPRTPVINQTATFDASNSKEGWSAKTQQFSPITSYKWNFSDGTGIITVPTPIVSHQFTEPGNYTVKLTVTDAVDRSDTISYLVEVQNVTAKLYDVNNDGIVDISDIYLAALAFGTTPGDPGWDPRCDVNKDDIIDIADIYMIALHYGEDP